MGSISGRKPNKVPMNASKVQHVENIHKFPDLRYAKKLNRKITHIQGNHKHRNLRVLAICLRLRNCNIFTVLKKNTKCGSVVFLCQNNTTNSKKISPIKIVTILY